MDIKEEWKDIINIITLVMFRLFPLREHFLTVKETVKENVPVDTDSGIHKLLVLLKFSCNWCTIDEHNFTQSAPFHYNLM